MIDPTPAPAAAPAAAPPATTTHLLYLHGFRSSPASFKATRLGALLAREHPALHWACPQLPPSPAQALAGLRRLVADWPRASSAVVGSSLGGFYATVLALELGWPAVVINPAVDPARDLAAHIGRQTMFHDAAESFYFQPGFVDELRTLTPAPGPLERPERFLALIAQGDEVLDWREMTARYAGCPIRLVPGSDHALSDFDDHVGALLAHLGLRAGPPPGGPAPLLPTNPS